MSALGFQVSDLTPGDWELITLENGWSNVSGYIPAQVRILQDGMSQVVGHIEGGDTPGSGQVWIGTLTGGYYNTVHAHVFTCNAVTGAATSAQGGTLVQDQVTPAYLPTVTWTGTVSGTTCEVTGGGFDLYDSGDNYQALYSQDCTTPVNKNSPTIYLDTSGNLWIQNVDSNVTQLSFNETLPLVTS